MESPCHYCKERILGCHSTCEKYIQFQEDNQKIMEKKKAENALKEVGIIRDRRISKKRRKS